MGRPGGSVLMGVLPLGTLAAPSRAEIAVAGNDGKVAPLGPGCHGIAWGCDGRTPVIPCMAERVSLSSASDGAALKPTGMIRTKDGPAGIRNAEPRGGTMGGSEDDNG